MKTNSIWLDTVKKPISYKQLDQDLNVDVLIIGGGITGMSIAYHLQNKGLHTALVERNKIGRGITSKTTGKIDYLQGLKYTKLKNERTAHLYLKSQLEAINLLKDIITKEKISCDLEQTSSVLIAQTEKEEKQLQEEFSFLKKENIPVTKLSNREIKVENTFHFHPLKYLEGLKSKLTIPIYENTNILKVKHHNDYYLCYTNEHQIKAKILVIACHYPFFLFPYLFPFKCYPEKSYIMAKKGVKQKENKITISHPTRSERTFKDYQLTLIGSHKTSDTFTIKENFAPLLNSNPDYIWSNEDVMTFDSLPFIGHLKENLYIATGYNTWGMTNATLAGKIISDLILKKPNPYIALFDPHRSNPLARITYLGKTGKEYLKAYVKPKTTKKLHYEDSKAIYNDNKEEIVVQKRCPHLGCPLIFNEVEQVWECPCHASKFTKEGYWLKGPSKKDITIAKTK